MLNKLSEFLFGAEKKTPQPVISKHEVKRVVNDILQTPRYPPFDNGMPAVDIDSIVETQSELIERIKISFGLSPQNFELYVMSAIRNYADYIHLLPATNKENHNNAGGMFRLGLEVGFYALQSANGKIFSNKESAEKRRILHPKWLFATFVAGMCSEMYRALTTMNVVSPGGDTWPHYTTPLYTWTKELKAEKYFINWTESTNHGFNLNATTSVVLPMILNPQCFNYIDNDKSDIVSCMINSINGSSRHGDGNIIGELVRNSKDHVIDNDMKSNATLYGKLTVGSHLEPHIVDIMRELIRDGAWTVNSNKSRIWYTKEGCFLVWTAAFNEIKNVMNDRKMSGLPSSSDTLAEMLMNSGLIEQHRNGGPYWEINLPNTPKLVETVKLVDPTIILTNEHSPNAEFSLLNPQPKPAATQAPNLTTQETTSAAEVNEVKVKPAEEQKPVSAPVVKAEQKPDQQKAKPVQPAAEPANKSSSSPTDAKPVPKTEVKAQEVQKAEVKTANVPTILDQMPEHTRNLINAIKADYSKKSPEYPVWMSAKGLVISKEEFESHGMPHIQVLDSLLANNWIYRDPDNNKVIYNTEKDGKKIRAYVIKKDIALAIGFKEE